MARLTNGMQLVLVYKGPNFLVLLSRWEFNAKPFGLAIGRFFRNLYRIRHVTKMQQNNPERDDLSVLLITFNP
jgi:hypothetical protein